MAHVAVKQLAGELEGRTCDVIDTVVLCCVFVLCVVCVVFVLCCVVLCCVCACVVVCCAAKPKNTIGKAGT